MQKTIFFWLIVVQFSISFFVTVLGIIGWVKIPDSILTTLVSVLIVEQAGAVFTIFKSTDFFDSKTSINDEGWDLLATLWKFQQQQFPNNPSRRWWMQITPLSQDFAAFAAGYSRLKHLHLVEISPENNISLSTTGYQFCQQNEKKLKGRKRLFYI